MFGDSIALVRSLSKLDPLAAPPCPAVPRPNLGMIHGWVKLIAKLKGGWAWEREELRAYSVAARSSVESGIV